MNKDNKIISAWQQNPLQRMGFMKMFFERHGEMLRKYIMSECMIKSKSLNEVKIEEILKEE